MDTRPIKSHVSLQLCTNNQSNHVFHLQLHVCTNHQSNHMFHYSYVQTTNQMTCFITTMYKPPIKSHVSLQLCTNHQSSYLFHYNYVQTTNHITCFITAIATAIMSVWSMFYFKVDIDYSYKYNLTQTKTFSQIRKDIQAEVKGRVQGFTAYAEFMEFFLMFSLVFVVIR